MKLTLGALLVAGASATPQIAKVVSLLGELKGKVQNDLAAEGKAMEEYSTFCDDEITEKKYAIKAAAREIEGYEAAVADSQGQIEKNDAVLEETSAMMAKKQSELSSATDVRKGENEDFQAAEKELLETVDTLARAITIIKREMSFVQGKGSTSKVAKKLGDLSVALGAIIEGAWVDPKQKQKVKAFLEDDDLSLTQQPQAAVYNYENHSSGIVATLEDMKDKAESSLNSLRREEMQSKHAYELLKQSLTDAMAVGEKEIAEAQAAKGAAAENQAKAQGNLSKTQASKKADEDYVATLENDCSNKAAEWSARQQQANAEIAALTKGAEVLQGGVKVFVQKKSALRRVASSDDKEEARQSVFKLLKKLGRQNNSFALMEMANAVTKDPFGKVRGLIEAMIAKLEKQAQDEATHEAFCKEEQAKSAKSRDTKQSTADKYQARIDEAKATLGELKNEIAELTAEINEIVKANAAATKLRQQEKADFTKAQKDYKDSVEAVGVSISTLKEYYRGETALVQQPSFGSAHTDASDMIIGILETAEAEFGKTLAEIETNETEAVESYEKLMQENKVSQATKEAEIKGKTSEIKSLEVSLANYSDDLQTVNKELDAVLDYIEKLKPQCANKAMTYEERKAKRETEMEGLQTALEILSGEVPAV